MVGQREALAWALEGTYWRVYLPASILAWGSELRLSRRMIILAFDLGSESSASACRKRSCRPEVLYLTNPGDTNLFIVH